MIAPVNAPLVAEELRLEKLACQSRAVQVDESFVLAAALFVQPSRENAFTRSGLSQNQDRALAFQSTPRFDLEIMNGSARAGERIDRRPAVAPLSRRLLASLALVVDLALDNDAQGRELHGFRQELNRAFLDGADGKIDRGESGQDDDRTFREEFLDSRQKIQSIPVRKLEIEESELRMECPRDALALGNRRGLGHLEPA